MDVRLELVNYYKQYVEYLEKRIDEAVESKEYQEIEDHKAFCISEIMPTIKEHKFGPFRWFSLKSPKPDVIKFWIEDLSRAEQEQHAIVDRYAPDPSFPSFIEWLSQPKLNQTVVDKLKAIRNR